MSAERAPKQGGGLSVQTLVIASLASMTAAVVIHKFWSGGAILGAAITPIIVAVTSEVLRKPIDRASRLAAEKRERTVATRGHATVPTGPPAPDPRGDDPFGIWQADRPRPWYRRLDGRHLRLALATGALAFLVGGFALTGAELVFGGSLGGGGDRTTLVGGDDRDRDRDRRERDRDEDAQPQTPSTTPAPTESTPEETPTTPAPAQPEPTPTEPAPAAPAPDPAQPAPEPAPDPAAPTG